jgi:hypothetical protein
MTIRAHAAVIGAREYEIDMCGKPGCISASGPSGWCWAHTPEGKADTAMDATEIDGIKGWVDIYKAGLKEKARIEEGLAIARAKIEEALGDNEVGLIDGQPTVKWTHVTTTRFDQGKAKTLLGAEQLASCMTETASRRFTLVSE